MSRIEEHCVQIDSVLCALRRHIQGMDVYNSMMKLGGLADLIERHRALINNELEGLRGDVKSAETAYERVVVEVKALQQEKDRWTNELLPGWRACVADAENELCLVSLDRDDLKKARDEWRQDAATSERKLEESMEAHERTKSNLGRTAEELNEMRSQRDALRDGYDRQRQLTREAIERERNVTDEMYELRKTSKFWEDHYYSVAPAPAEVDPEFAEVGESARTIAMDTGAPEGDQSVAAWTCTCGLKHSAILPKLSAYHARFLCKCGASLDVTP